MDCQAGHADTTSTTPEPGPDLGFAEAELFAELASRLKDAHTRVRRLCAPDTVKAALVRRLLVITDASKHDLADAARRLGKLVAELDSGVMPSANTAETLNPLRHKGDSPVR